MKVWTCFAVVITIGLAFWSHILTYQIAKVTDAYLNRAQVAADREDMMNYLKLYMQGLRDFDAHHGHTAFIWKRPDNDLGLMYKSVSQLQDRLYEIRGIDKAETAYQVALDDIRGTIREIENPSGGIAWVKYDWKFVIAGIALWAFTGLCAIGAAANSTPPPLRYGGYR